MNDLLHTLFALDSLVKFIYFNWLTKNIWLWCHFDVATPGGNIQINNQSN